MASEPYLPNGTAVVFTKESGNSSLDSSTHIVESSDQYEGIIFYRLKGIDGGLFLRSSLATVEECKEAAMASEMNSKIPDDLMPLVLQVHSQPYSVVLSLIERIAALEALLTRFHDKLTIILPKVDSFIVLQAVRSGNNSIYDGPTIAQEMEDAKKLLGIPRAEGGTDGK